MTFLNGLKSAGHRTHTGLFRNYCQKAAFYVICISASDNVLAVWTEGLGDHMGLTEMPGMVIPK